MATANAAGLYRPRRPERTVLYRVLAQHFERIFRAELLRTLLGKGLFSQEIVDNLLSWHHSGFSVHGEVHAHDRDSAAARAVGSFPAPSGRAVVRLRRPVSASRGASCAR